MHTINVHVESGGTTPPILTSALNEGEWSAPLLMHFTTGKSPWYPMHRNRETGWEGGGLPPVWVL